MERHYVPIMEDSTQKTITKLICRFNEIAFKISLRLLCRDRQDNSKISMERKN